MDALLDKISLRETFKSFLPAFYLILFIIPLIKQINLCEFAWDKSLDIYSTLIPQHYSLTLFISA